MSEDVSHWWGPLFRTIVEEGTAQQDLDSHSQEFERFTDVWTGLSFLLCRKPEKIGIPRDVSGTIYYLTHRAGEKTYGLPDIAVIYTFDEKHVYVHGIKCFYSED